MFHLTPVLRILTLLIFLGAVIDAAPVFRIHKTTATPFTASGDRNNAAWLHADAAVALVDPKTTSVETDWTYAQALYDSTNLYVSLRAYFKPVFRSDRSIKRSLFADNNFEFFIKKEGQDDYQFVVSEGGLIHTGINGGKPVTIPGLQKHVLSKKNHWMANLVIPLASIGLKPEPQKLRFNVCRFNIDLPQGKRQMSSFMVVSGQPNYHASNLWSQAEMTQVQGSNRQLYADSETIRFNLIRNPRFDFNTETFNNPHIQRVETAPMSGKWLLRVTGKAYQFYGIYLAGSILEGKPYTLRVKARRFGNGGSLGCLQLRRAEDGKYREGRRPGWGIPLTTEFNDYNMPFTGDKNTISLFFYQIGNNDPQGGIEVAEISLFKGHVSAFEIRQVSRPGLKNVVPGTAPRRSLNSYGTSPDKLRILVIGSSLSSLVDPLEIFSGMNVQADLITTTGNNIDVYYTYGDPQTIVETMKRNQYDLIMLGGRDVPRKIGPELAKQLEQNVRQGTAFFLNSPAPFGNLSSMLKQAKLTPLSDNHALKQALPMDFHVQPKPVPPYSHRPLNDMRQGLLGKGRVLTAVTSHRDLLFQMIQDPVKNTAGLFPWSRFNKAWLARLITYAAGRNDLSLKVNSVLRGKVSLSASLPDGTRLAWEIWDKLGTRTACGNAVLKAGKAIVDTPEPELKQPYLLTVRALNDKAQTLDYTTATVTIPGPKLVSLKDVKLFHRGNDQAQILVTLKDATENMTLEWSLEDFSGRTLLRGTAPARQNERLDIPLTKLFTNLGLVQVNLSQNGKRLDSARIHVVAQDRDKKRVFDDFTPSIWNFGTDVTPELTQQTHRQLEAIGFRSYLLPFQGVGTLKSGMTSGSMWRASWGMIPQGPQRNNVRYPQYNSAAARQGLRKSAMKLAAEERQIGIIQDSLADEPQITNHNNSAELDEHPENLAEYRKRMQAKYGTITTFNQRMGSAYKDFTQLKPAHLEDARKTGRFGEFIEWRNFNVDRWCEAIKWISDACKEADPNSCLSLTNSFGESPFNGNDYWKLLTKAGLNFSHEYTSMVYQGGRPNYEFDDVYRSFRPDMRVWGWIGYFYTKEMAFFQPWWFALHRYGGFSWFATYACVGAGGGGSWMNILDNVSGAYTQDAKNVADSLRKSNLQNGLGKVFLDYRWAKNDVALYYSFNSYLMAFALGKELKDSDIYATGPLHDMLHSRYRLKITLQELLYQYEYLAPEQVLQGKLKDRKVLFMPSVRTLSQAEVTAIKNFMDQGGQVIADFLPGERDELGNLRADNPLKDHENMIVLEQHFNSNNRLQRRVIKMLLKEAGCQPILKNRDVLTLHGREAVHFQDGNMHLFGILRDQTRSRDHLTQTFTFPVKGHLYDLRAGKYLGVADSVTAAVPHGEASVWGIYPYKIKGIAIQAPKTVAGLDDFKATFTVMAEAKPGHHVIHAELIAPNGECRFFMQRNLSAPNGIASMTIPMADNDPKGTWILKVTDALSGVSATQEFLVK